MSDLREAAPQTRLSKNRWTEQGAINPTRQLTELVLEAGLRRRSSIFVLFGLENNHLKGNIFKKVRPTLGG